MGHVHSNSHLGLAMLNYTSKSYSSFKEIWDSFPLILVHSVVKPGRPSFHSNRGENFW